MRSGGARSTVFTAGPPIAGRPAALLCAGPMVDGQPVAHMAAAPPVGRGVELHIGRLYMAGITRPRTADGGIILPSMGRLLALHLLAQQWASQQAQLSALLRPRHTTIRRPITNRRSPDIPDRTAALGCG